MVSAPAAFVSAGCAWTQLLCPRKTAAHHYQMRAGAETLFRQTRVWQRATCLYCDGQCGGCLRAVCGRGARHWSVKQQRERRSLLLLEEKSSRTLVCGFNSCFDPQSCSLLTRDKLDDDKKSSIAADQVVQMISGGDNAETCGCTPTEFSSCIDTDLQIISCTNAKVRAQQLQLLPTRRTVRIATRAATAQAVPAAA